MKKSSAILPSVLTAAALIVSPAHAREKVVAYVPNWIDLGAFSKTIDYAKITHINIAFENPADDEGELSFEEQDEALIETAHARGVKVLVSIGGGSASKDKTTRALYSDLLEDEARPGFVAKIAGYLSAHHFDGLDVDLEGPLIGDNYGVFIEDLAAALKPKGRLLTAALSQGYGGSKVPDSILPRFDFVNIMAYDETGPWDAGTPGQHSSIEFAKNNVDYWLKRGLAKSKAVLGVPFYGYGFGEASRKRDYPYSEIVASFPGAENSDETGATIYYNGLPTIRAKCGFVVKESLAGVMIWSLDYDVKGERSLLNAIHQALKPRPARP